MRIFLTLLAVIISTSTAEIPLWGLRNLTKHDTKNTDFRSGEYLLPTDVVPLEYDIQLLPYLETPETKAFTFDGSVMIRLRVDKATDLIRMHAFNMTIDFESIIVKKIDDGSILNVIRSNTSTDDKQFFDIQLETFLTVDLEYSFEVNFIGILNDDLTGFYRSSYQNDNGDKRWLGTTFFQTTGARRAFPCFDEPIWRANFTIQIAHEPGYHVISNMPTDGQDTPVEDHPELIGWTWTHFQPSVRMASYLVAFVVSDFDFIIHPDDSRFRVLSRPGTAHQGEYGNDLATKIMAYLEDHTGHKYSLPTFDQIAVPDFIAGAMENWGLVTFREDALLFEEGVSTVKNKRRVATVVTHELAHQWFGDLVSPKWWDSIWLNEGWATFYEYHALATVETDWQIDQQFVQEEMHASLRADALPSAHPLVDTVENPNGFNPVFDGLAYTKGGPIVRFLIGLLGITNFKIGLKQYLDNHAFGNADSEDLWSAMQTAVPPGLLPDSKDLSAVMWSWTKQAGCPVINVTRNYEQNTAVFSQERFVMEKSPEVPYDELWSVPLTMTTAAAPNFEDLMVKLWLTERQAEIEVPTTSDHWLVVNLQQIGFYRVNYDSRNWELLFSTLNNPTTMQDIHPVTRGQLINDALTLANAKHLDFTTALSTTSYLHLELEYMPWATALAELTYIYDRMNVDHETRTTYELYMQEKLDAVYTSVGIRVSEDDPHLLRWKRVLVADWACRLEHKQCNNDSAQLFAEWKVTQNPDIENPIFEEVKSTVYCAGMRTGNEADFDFLMTRYKNAIINSQNQEVSLIITAMGCSSDLKLLERYLSASITPETSGIRAEDCTSVFNAVYNNPVGVDLAFKFLMNSYIQAAPSYGGFAGIGYLFIGISNKLNTQEQRNELQEFRDLNEGTLGEALPGIETALLNIDKILQWQESHGVKVRAYFASQIDNSVAMLSAFNTLIVFFSLTILIFNM